MSELKANKSAKEHAVAKISIQNARSTNLAKKTNDMHKTNPRIFTNIFPFLPRTDKKREKCKRTVCMKQGGKDEGGGCHLLPNLTGVKCRNGGARIIEE